MIVVIGCIVLGLVGLRIIARLFEMTKHEPPKFLYWLVLIGVAIISLLVTVTYGCHPEPFI